MTAINETSLKQCTKNKLHDIPILIGGKDVMIDPFPNFDGGKNCLWR